MILGLTFETMINAVPIHVVTNRRVINILSVASIRRCLLTARRLSPVVDNTELLSSLSVPHATVRSDQ